MIRLHKYLAALVLTAILAASYAEAGFAKELRPLDELAGSAAPPYPLTRCGALYQAVLEWAGEQRLGPDTWATTDTLREQFLTIAILMASTNGQGPVEQVAPTVARDARNIADLYLERFEKNYAAEGQAFGTDPLVQSDLSLCKEIAENGSLTILPHFRGD